MRLIDVSSFALRSSGEFVGFIYGILSQDHDLEQIYLDSFLKISQTDENTVNEILDRLDGISKEYNVTFIFSISINENGIDPKFKENIIAAL